ncbi:MAG TPA: TRAP transporter substrate-binding protein DctP [Pseudolabrys sp.]|nr:TRAP transporter substrate-binding protein DctP [Pseudolabrys sp.]
MLIALLVLLAPTLAAAEPIELKLAFFSSDRTYLYTTGVQPFVDAINASGEGRLHITVYFSGALGNDLAHQTKLLRDGTADIAYIVQPYEPQQFPDSRLIELPGLYRDAREATRVFSALVARGQMRGFDDFHVIGAFAGDPEYVHSRPPIGTLAQLKGKRIRTNNDTEDEILTRFGAVPTFVPINKVAETISSGVIDGALAPPAPIFDFGIARVAPNHYMLPTSSVPLSLLMTRKRFDSLPPDAQALIRKFGGDRFIETYIRTNEAATAAAMARLKTDPHRTVVFPSAADRKTADAVFASVVDAYAIHDPHNLQLVVAAREILASLRDGK